MDQASTGSTAWFAVLTKPRAESIASTHLRRQGFEVLDCRLRKSRPGAEGLREQVEPLFPRYVFLRSCASGQTLGPVRSTRGVAGVVRFGNRTPTVPEAVIDALRARQDHSGCVQLDPPGSMSPGDRVQVRQGPLYGLEGVFETECSLNRVRLLVEVLGAPVRVTLPKSQWARSLLTDWS